MQEERFLPAKVVTPFKKGESATVELLNGTKHTLSKADLDFVCDCNAEALSENNDDSDVKALNEKPST